MAVNEGPGTSYSGRLKPFMSYRTRYATLSTLKERTTSNSSIASLAGNVYSEINCTQNYKKYTCVNSSKYCVEFIEVDKKEFNSTIDIHFVTLVLHNKPHTLFASYTVSYLLA